MNLLILSLLLNVTAAAGTHCELVQPPASAGESQAHGVILYLYPRNHTIDAHFNGCQSQWFLDEDHYRKLSLVHYKEGIAIAYDNINPDGKVGFQCRYAEGALSSNSDPRCPGYQQLRRKTFQAGCYSQSELNSSGSYQPASADCVME